MSEEKDKIQLYLQAPTPGDIKEDVQYLGLTIKDLVVTVIGSLLMMSLTLLLPMSGLIRLFTVLTAFFAMLFYCYAKVAYRIKRRKHFISERKEGTGVEIGSLLGVEADGAFYRSGNRWHITFAVTPPPWSLAVAQQKKSRVHSFGEVLRYCAEKKIAVAVFEERVPDFQHDMWEKKQKKTSQNEKVEKMKHRRIAHFQRRIDSGVATKKEFHLTLEIDETELPNYKVTNRNRDKIIENIREIITTVESILQRSAHNPVIISGYTIPEIVGRQWAPFTWERWKQAGGKWDSDEPDVLVSVQQKPITDQRKFHKSISKIRFKDIVEKLRFPVKTSGKHKQTGETSKVPKEEKKNKKTAAPQDTHVRTGDILKEIALAFTSPAPTGKSFIANNVAAAYSTISNAVYVIDLSPDRAALTYLNPIFQMNREGWGFYACRNMPAITVMVPETEEAALDILIDHLKEPGVVKVLDLPWDHPWKEDIQQYTQTVIIFDSDYHHFLSFQENPEHKNSVIWWNKQDEHYRMNGLLKELGLSAAKQFPVYHGIAKNLWYGKPFVLDDEEAVVDHFFVREGEVHD